MDFLPQKEASGTRALCALFESKATLQQSFNSSPRLNWTSATGSKTGRDCLLQGWRSHNTPLKDTTIQVCQISAVHEHFLILFGFMYKSLILYILPSNRENTY